MAGLFSPAPAREGWKQGFLDTGAGETRASVRFRFSERPNDETTAHETGTLNYRLESASGEVTGQYVHFEALPVKKDGWEMVMECQQRTATGDDWKASN